MTREEVDAIIENLCRCVDGSINVYPLAAEIEKISYEEGYKKGYENGYDEGYSDGNWI